jgi:hypothetical protein
MAAAAWTSDPLTNNGDALGKVSHLQEIEGRVTPGPFFLGHPLSGNSRMAKRQLHITDSAVVQRRKR